MLLVSVAAKTDFPLLVPVSKINFVSNHFIANNIDINKIYVAYCISLSYVKLVFSSEKLFLTINRRNKSDTRFYFIVVWGPIINSEGLSR